MLNIKDNEDLDPSYREKNDQQGEYQGSKQTHGQNSATANPYVCLAPPSFLSDLFNRAFQGSQAAP